MKKPPEKPVLSLTQAGVSCTFFVTATNALRRQYGERLVDAEGLNKIIRSLSAVERNYQELPKRTRGPCGRSL